MKVLTNSLVISAVVVALSATSLCAAEPQTENANTNLAQDTTPAAPSDVKDKGDMKEKMHDKMKEKMKDRMHDKMKDRKGDGDMHEGNKPGKMREEIPENIRAELKAFHEKKKALFDSLSPEAKAVLEKRKERRMHKMKEHMGDRIENHMEEKMEGKKERMKERMEEKKSKMKEHMEKKNEAAPAPAAAAPSGTN